MIIARALCLVAFGAALASLDLGMIFTAGALLATTTRPVQRALGAIGAKL